MEQKEGRLKQGSRAWVKVKKLEKKMKVRRRRELSQKFEDKMGKNRIAFLHKLVVLFSLVDVKMVSNFLELSICVAILWPTRVVCVTNF